MSGNKPRVSVGLPVYNGENFLEQALDSILAQTFTDFELIISDNASTDRTEEICRAYAARDQRVRYYRNSENIGQFPNFNRVFQLSSGEYFKWLAHDDICLPEFLERCVAHLDQHPEAILSYPRTKIINEHGESIWHEYTDDLDLRSPSPYERYKQVFNLLLFNPMGADRVSPVFSLMRRDILAITPQHGSYNAADHVLLAGLAVLGQFHEIPEYLLLRREHPERSARAVRGSFSFERAVFVDPANKNRLHLPGWKLFSEFNAAINRAPMSMADRVRCYSLTAQWFWSVWGPKKMVKELVTVPSQVWRLSTSSGRS